MPSDRSARHLVPGILQMHPELHMGFRIIPPEPPNDGILFVDHQSAGRSGHNGQAVLEYCKDHLIAFYLNGAANDQTRNGHHPLGWSEYRKSSDAGQTWGPPQALDYSKHIDAHPDYFSAYVKQVVAAPDGALVAMGCRFFKDYPTFDKAFVLRSQDEGDTWSEATDLGGDDPVLGRPQAARVYDGTIYVLMTHGPVWGDQHPHRLYVSQDNGQSFQRRSDLTLDPECWYGALSLLDDGRMIAYGYKSRDEHHLQYVTSADWGHTWSAPQTTFMAKRIRNPILSEKIGRYYFLHGRSGQVGENAKQLVLYASTDGIYWDSGRFLNTRPGMDSYSANAVVGKFDPTLPKRLLIQSSIAYDGNRRVNVHHWWIEDIEVTDWREDEGT